MYAHSSSHEEDQLPPLQEGEIFIIHHPSSHQPSQKLPASCVLGKRHDMNVIPNSLPIGTTPPWALFHTRADFEQSEHFVTHGLSNPIINDQLKLLQRHSRDSGVTLTKAQDMHAVLKAAADESDIMAEVNLSFKHSLFSIKLILHSFNFRTFRCQLGQAINHVNTVSISKIPMLPYLAF
jgi:hypothetical protein